MTVKRGDILRKLLFKVLPFEAYLTVLSRGFFSRYDSGRLKADPLYKYHYYLATQIRTGQTVVDIGANLGYYTRLFSRWVGASGQVHAFEPVRPIFNVLSRNTRDCANVKLYNCALGNEDKPIKLGNNSRRHQSFISSGEHFVIDDPKQDSACDEFEASMCDARKLFEDFERIDFIKCDVEGYEVVILPLLAPVIQRHRPKLLVESGGEKRQQVLNLMEGLEYDAYVLVSDGLKKATEVEAEDDILFIPRA